MKTILWRATLGAGIAAAAMLPAAAQAQTQGGVAPQRPVGTSVAVLDVNSVFKNFNRFNAQMADIKNDIQAFEAYVRDERNKLTAESEKLKEYNPGTPIYKDLEKKIADMSADVQVQMQLKRKEFLEAEARVYFNAYTQIVDEVTIFAERNGVGLVLRFNSEQINPQDPQTVLQGVNRAVVYQNRLNITGLILDRLNRGSAEDAVSSNAPQIPRTR